MRRLGRGRQDLIAPSLRRRVEGRGARRLHRRQRLAVAPVEGILVVVHLLAAAVWVGGSTALVFVGVPAIRTLEGEPRGRAMKELGLRWRPLGYGALLVAGLTGGVLASDDWGHGTRVQFVVSAD